MSLHRSVRLLVAVMTITLGAPAHAICRMVVAVDSPPPVVDPAQSVLMVFRHGVPVGQNCPPAPPNMSGGGGDADAGMSGGDDAMPPDPADLSGLDDLSVPSDDMQSLPPADLGCQDRLGDAITMVVQPQFSIGPRGSRFAMLMVTPALPTVSLAPKTLFHDLAATTAPKVDYVDTYVEDPSLGYKCNDPKSGGGCGGDFNFGGGFNNGPNVGTPLPTNYDGGLPDAPFTLGSYEIAVLGTSDLDAVKGWLDAHGYAYTADDIAALKPYVDHGWIVTAVRVVADQAAQHEALDPMAFTYEGSSLRLPIAVSHDPSPVPVPITAYVAAEGRYDFPGAHISYADFASAAQGTQFLTRSDLSIPFNITFDQDPIAQGKPNVEAHDHVQVKRTIAVPSSQCPSQEKGFCGCRVGAGGAGLGASPLVGCARLILLVRRRRRARA